ncbi:MAG: LysM peptidoglycan-binding domain-containing protein [Candidatus Latescibacteria bacterium]|nr:LysM peptidoglycan-binding domain-containing protein [Candidatus Latescibacterota bacterium]
MLRYLFLLFLLCAAPAGVLAKSTPTHVVKRGDTLINIAARYQLSVRQLRQWNGLHGDRLAIGQQLTLSGQNQPIAFQQFRPKPAKKKVKKVATVPRSREADAVLQARFAAWSDSAIALSRRRGGYALVVNKQERQMDVYLAGERISTLPVAIGSTDAEQLVDRRQANDYHLKEGLFHLSEVSWSRRVAKWDCVWMRIHTVEAAKRDYGEVFGAEGRRRIESWEASHGAIRSDGDVQGFNRAHPGAHIWRGLGVHGGGADYDWTEGCVALDRKNIRWLYDRLSKMSDHGVGTPIAVVRY